MGALKAPRILLPRNPEWEKWAVVACDQFTSQPEYWEKLDAYVQTAPSTLRMVLPELYLDGNVTERAEEINAFMDGYLSEGVFETLEEGFILVERSTPYRARRLGLVAAVDLECYDYRVGTKSLIRATEGTIESRIPPRLAIRKDAPIELPHVILLSDDERKGIIESLYDRRDTFRKVYDFDLNMGGGHLVGWHITGQAVNDTIAAFERLAATERMTEKYGDPSGFLFAVGDGNHSLATAKAHWNKVKETLSDGVEHPARYALAEIVNLYDDGIYFEPIHRYVKGVDQNVFIEKLLAAVSGNYRVYNGEMRVKTVDCALPQTIRTLDSFIEGYLAEHGGTVDYVHGEQAVCSLVDGDNTSVAVLLETLKKEELFPFAAKYGALPKKTFSMGEAVEKRYYVEGKRIRL